MNNDEFVAFRAEVNAKLDTLIKNTGDHETRMRSLEAERWLHRGGLAVVTFIVAKLGLPLTWHV